MGVKVLFLRQEITIKIQNTEVKEKLVLRLNRIEGQVRGLRTMFTDERDCHEIMQQLTAVHSAIQSTSRTFFKSMPPPVF